MKIDFSGALDRTGLTIREFSIYPLLCGYWRFFLIYIDTVSINSTTADSCQSRLANVVSWVPEGSVLGPLLFLLCISELFYILENKPMTPLWWLLCQPQSLELQLQSSWIVTSLKWLICVTVWGWNRMRAQIRLW